MAKTKEEFQEEILKFSKTHEFKTFWLAIVLSSSMDKDLDADQRNKLKGELKREIGIASEASKEFKKNGIKAVHDDPDVLFTLNFHTGKLNTAIKPLLVYGLYCKQSREIPQSKWPCKRCAGQGCPHCNGEGAMYTETVEGFLGDPLMKASKGKATKMHACGREDVDARMLGEGRPFILEIVSPQKRSLDLAKIRKQADKLAKGKSSFSELSFVTQKELDVLNMSHPDKTYEVTATCKRKIDAKDIAKILKLKGKILNQHTPTRVLHRRADLLRKRKILSISAKQASSNSLLLKLRVQSGTYIKELVSGDNERTKPSISSILGCECVPSNLDVLVIHFSFPRKKSNATEKKIAKKSKNKTKK